MTDSRIVGPRISQDRENAEVSVADFAAAVGLTPDQLMTIESGLVETPYIILLRAAVVLSISPSKWLKGITASGDEFTQSLLDNADGHYKLLDALVDSHRTKRRVH